MVDKKIIFQDEYSIGSEWFDEKGKRHVDFVGTGKVREVVVEKTFKEKVEDVLREKGLIV